MAGEAPGGLQTQNLDGGIAGVHVHLGAQDAAGDQQSMAAVQRMLRAKAARTAMMERWSALGGPDSDLGLPLETNFPLQDAGSHFEVQFRGGTLNVLSDGSQEVRPDEIVVSASYRVAVTFEGMGLEMRQESDGDELYGTMSVAEGSRKALDEYTIPQIVLGPDANNRIYQTSMELYKDRPPSDISIAIKVFEHDSGDRDKLREEIRKRVRQVFQNATQAVGGLVPGPLGAAAGALSNEVGTQDSLVNWAVTGLADGIDAFLGMGDDEYNGVILTIPYEDMIRIPPLHTYRCSHDPRTIQYTHKVTVNGRDDGNDLGQVSLLFKVRSIL